MYAPLASAACGEPEAYGQCTLLFRITNGVSNQQPMILGVVCDVKPRWSSSDLLGPQQGCVARDIPRTL